MMALVRRRLRTYSLLNSLFRMFASLPRELTFYVLRCVDVVSLMNCSLVSNELRHVASEIIEERTQELRRLSEAARTEMAAGAVPTPKSSTSVAVWKRFCYARIKHPELAPEFHKYRNELLEEFGATHVCGHLQVFVNYGWFHHSDELRAWGTGLCMCCREPLGNELEYFEKQDIPTLQPMLPVHLKCAALVSQENVKNFAKSPVFFKRRSAQLFHAIQTAVGESNVQTIYTAADSKPLWVAPVRGLPPGISLAERCGVNLHEVEHAAKEAETVYRRNESRARTRREQEFEDLIDRILDFLAGRNLPVTDLYDLKKFERRYKLPGSVPCSCFAERKIHVEKRFNIFKSNLRVIIKELRKAGCK